MRDLGDRLDLVVDGEAEPGDLDRSLAEFLLASIRRLETVAQPADEQIEESSSEMPR